MEINLVILEWMIAERELLLKLREKERAVRAQDFQKAAILLEEQLEIEKRLPTLEQLQDLRQQYKSNSHTDPSAGGEKDISLSAIETSKSDRMPPISEPILSEEDLKNWEKENKG